MWPTSVSDFTNPPIVPGPQHHSGPAPGSMLTPQAHRVGASSAWSKEMAQNMSAKLVNQCQIFELTRAPCLMDWGSELGWIGRQLNYTVS